MKKLVMCLMMVLMVSGAVNANGLLGCWDFNGNTNDVSGYGAAANATLTGTSALVVEGGRNALSAVGGGAAVTVNTDKFDDIIGQGMYYGTNPVLRGSGITLSVWVKPNNVEEQWKPMLGFTGGWGIRLFSMNSGYIGDVQTATDGWNPNQVWAGKDWSGQVAGAPSTAWHHILFTYDGTVDETRGYIDGVLRQTVEKSGVPGWWAASTDPFYIGWDHESKSYNGFLADAAVFSGAADLADAVALYTGTATPFTVDIVSVPEPASMVLLGLGALGLIRRKK